MIKKINLSKREIKINKVISICDSHFELDSNVVGINQYTTTEIKELFDLEKNPRSLLEVQNSLINKHDEGYLMFFEVPKKDSHFYIEYIKFISDLSDIEPTIRETIKEQDARGE